ncbi:hypothetical protein AgCh_001648 [Apium graveolens]
MARPRICSFQLDDDSPTYFHLFTDFNRKMGFSPLHFGHRLLFQLHPCFIVPRLCELLEWPKTDKHRFLNAVSRVGDLVRTIKFYTEGFGMKLLRKRDIPEEKNTNAFLGFGPEESQFVVELTYNMFKPYYVT